MEEEKSVGCWNIGWNGLAIIAFILSTIIALYAFFVSKETDILLRSGSLFVAILTALYTTYQVWRTQDSFPQYVIHELFALNKAVSGAALWIVNRVRGHVTEEHNKTRTHLGNQISNLPEQYENQRLKSELVAIAESLTHQIKQCDGIHKVEKMMKTSAQFDEYCGQVQIRLAIDLQELSCQYFNLCNELRLALVGIEEVSNKRKYAPQKTQDKWDRVIYGQRKTEISYEAEKLLEEVKNKL